MPKPTLIIALDLEGTIVQDNRNPRPRPGLYKFLDLLHDLNARVVMMTTVPVKVFRSIAKVLVDQGAAPFWFADVEYIDWQRPYKSLKFIPGHEPDRRYLVDDYSGYVDPDDKEWWIPIDTFFDQGNEDDELGRVSLELLALITKGKLQKRSAEWHSYQDAFGVDGLDCNATTQDILEAVKESRERVPGRYKGQISIAPDFDETPEDVIADFIDFEKIKPEKL